MGLSKAEIAKRMESIVEFTELGEFLSFPVRTYSAGMQARLTFAIATSIEPEILLSTRASGSATRISWRRQTNGLRPSSEMLAFLCWHLIRRILSKAFATRP